MAEFERSTTVGVGADAAFAFLADPVHLPEYVSPMTLVESTAIDGELPAEGDDQDRDAASQVPFLADAASRRIEWGVVDGDYGGSMTVAAGTASTSQVTIQLHTRAAVDAAEIDKVLDLAVRNLRRLLSGR